MAAGPAPPGSTAAGREDVPQSELQTRRRLKRKWTHRAACFLRREAGHSIILETKRANDRASERQPFWKNWKAPVPNAGLMKERERGWAVDGKENQNEEKWMFQNNRVWWAGKWGFYKDSELQNFREGRNLIRKQNWAWELKKLPGTTRIIHSRQALDLYLC